MKRKHIKFCLIEFLLSTAILVSCTGCSIGNIKIIEKAPKSPASSADSSTDFKTVLSPASKDDSEAVSHSTVQYVSSPPKEYYVKEDTSLVDTPAANSTIVENISKGSKISVIGFSSDKIFAAVQTKTKGNPEFILSSLLSESPISNASLASIPPTSSAAASSQSPSSAAPPASQNTDPQSAQESSQTVSSEINPYVPSHRTTSSSPQRVQGGIAYPNNPASTSVNHGITFANVSIYVVSVTSTSILSGPGSANSGYSVIMSIPEHTRLRATGIGQNGYVRVSVNGNTGFIASSDLKIF